MRILSGLVIALALLPACSKKSHLNCDKFAEMEARCAIPTNSTDIEAFRKMALASCTQVDEASEGPAEIRELFKLQSACAETKTDCAEYLKCTRAAFDATAPK